MSFLIRQTLIYAIPLMIVALAGIFAERSGIINLALEGIMIFGAFIGVLFVRILQATGSFDAAKAAGDWMALQGYMLLSMLAAAALGAVFSLLLAFAAINLKADQTIGGTALNMLAPALVLFLIQKYYLEKKTAATLTGKASRARAPIDDRSVRVPLVTICSLISAFVIMMYIAIPFGALFKLWGRDYSL